MGIRRTGGAVIAVLIVLIAAGVPAYGQRAPRESTVLRPFLSGNAFLNKGKYRLAVDEYRQFLTSHPHHEKAPVARYGLGVCQFRLGDYRDAVTELKHLLDDNDFEFAVETLMLLAQSHLAIDEPQEAAMYSRQVLEDCNASPSASPASLSWRFNLPICGPISLLIFFCSPREAS